MASIINSENEFDELMIKLNNLTVIDNLTTNDTANPLSANQGKILDEKITTLLSYTQTGWIPITATLIYASADSPIFVVNTSTDLRNIINIGNRIKLTQISVKYFIVVAITETTMTLYGGTDYTLTNTAITNVFFSNQKAPLDFPLNPDKWSITVINTVARTQSAPVVNTWYNVGSIKINIPVGIWCVDYQCEHFAQSSGYAEQLLKTTLSTSASTESDKELTHRTSSYGLTVIDTCHKRKTVTVTTDITLYLNLCTSTSGIGSIGRNGAEVPTVLKAVCAYL